MKIKVIKTAFYNGAIVNVNDVIDFKGDKLPLWGTLASGKQQQKQQNKKQENKQQQKQQNKKQENKQQQKQQEDAEKLPDNNEQVNGTLFGEDIAETENESEEKQDYEVPAVDDVDANNAAKLAVLENLLNKSVELNCPIDTENKTIQQQIDELTKVIAEKESKK